MQRVERLERDRPEFVTAMTRLGEQASEMLSEAESRRRAAVMRENRQDRAKKAEEDSQPELHEEITRGAILRDVRARRGWH